MERQFLFIHRAITGHLTNVALNLVIALFLGEH